MHDELLSKFFFYFQFISTSLPVCLCVMACLNTRRDQFIQTITEKKCERHPLLFVHLHLRNLDVGVLAVQNKLPVFKCVYRNL